MDGKAKLGTTSFLAIVLTALLMKRFPDLSVAGISLFSVMVAVCIVFVIELTVKKVKKSEDKKTTK